MAEKFAMLHFPWYMGDDEKGPKCLLTLEKFVLTAYVQVRIISGHKIFVTIVFALNVAEHSFTCNLEREKVNGYAYKLRISSTKQ